MEIDERYSEEEVLNLCEEYDMEDVFKSVDLPFDLKYKMMSTYLGLDDESL